MGVTSAVNMAAADGGFDREGNRTYTEEWNVYTDDANDHASTVLVSDLIPKLFDLYLPGNSFDTGAYVISKQARRNEEIRTLWHVRINYSTAGASNNARDGDGRKPDDPLNEPAVIQYRSGSEEKTLEQAYRGDFYSLPDTPTITDENIAAGKQPVVNSAGEYFDPPYMRPDYYRVVTITRNEADYNDFRISEMIGTVNGQEFRGRVKYTWRLADVTAEEMRKGGQVYHRVTYELHYNPDRWIVSALDQGFKVLQGGVLKPARDATDTRYGDPVLLDGAGAQLAVGANAKFRPFIPHNIGDWSILNLDN
jgi:hypothetical protein